MHDQQDKWTLPEAQFVLLKLFVFAKMNKQTLNCGTTDGSGASAWLVWSVIHSISSVFCKSEAVESHFSLSYYPIRRPSLDVRSLVSFPGLFAIFVAS